MNNINKYHWWLVCRLWGRNGNKGRKKPIWLSEMISLVLHLYSLNFLMIILSPPLPAHNLTWICIQLPVLFCFLEKQTEKNSKTSLNLVFICAPRSAKLCSSVDWNYVTAVCSMISSSYSLIYLINKIYRTFICQMSQDVTTGVPNCLYTKNSNRTNILIDS